METYVCKVCGHVAFGEAPERCPVCGAPKTAFALDANAIKKPADPQKLNDLEKKHVPVIKITKQYDSSGTGYIDVDIKVGDIMHVMEAKHYIMYIDVYLDYKFIARCHFTPEKVNPIVDLDLKMTGGKVLALENCNIHGRWIAEEEI